MNTTAKTHAYPPVPADRLNMREQDGAAGFGAEPFGDEKHIAISGIVDAILEVGRQRNSLLSQLRSALQSGQDDVALVLARQLCGISNHEEESNRTHSRVH
jgi:hypothetical protein